MPLSPVHLLISETTPNSSKLLCLILAIIYICILLFPSTSTPEEHPNILIQLFALIPIYTFSEKFYIFNIVTFPLVEEHIFVLLIQCWIFLYITNFVNQKFHWNDSMIVKFCLICTVTVGFSVFVVDSLFGFPSSRLTEAHVPVIEGMEALILSWMVVIKQVAPEEALLVSGFRGKQAWLVWIIWILFWGCAINALHFSMSYVLYSTVVRAVGFCVAIVTAWVYLRFFQVKDDGGVGDEADSFAFVTFFPASMRAQVAPVLDLIERLVQRMPGGGAVATAVAKRSSEGSQNFLDSSHVISMDFGRGIGEQLDTEDGDGTDPETLRKKQREAALREVQARLKS